jgi:hypothetical protein
VADSFESWRQGLAHARPGGFRSPDATDARRPPCAGRHRAQRAGRMGSPAATSWCWAPAPHQRVLRSDADRTQAPAVDLAAGPEKAAGPVARFRSDQPARKPPRRARPAGRADRARAGHRRHAGAQFVRTAMAHAARNAFLRTWPNCPVCCARCCARRGQARRAGETL